MLRLASLLSIGLLPLSTIAQSVIGAAGGSATVGTLHVDQTIGEPVITTLDGGGLRLTQGFHQAEPVRVSMNIRAFLQGPYDPIAGDMDDGLRAAGLVPLTEPYTALGYTQIGGGGEVTTASVLAGTGSNAIVDWIFLELRDASDPTLVHATRCALLQVDGDIVETDGSSPVSFSAADGSYHIAVRHRNHLALMSASPLALTSTASSIDFTMSSTPTYGTEAQASAGSVMALWCGDVTGDGVLKYTGATNDRDPILVAIGGTVPTNVVSGYRVEDVNLDGSTKYTGAKNDRDPILVNIGGTVPTNVRNAQLP